MKPRTKKRIEKAVKREESYLKVIIEASVKRETSDAEHIQSQENLLKELRAEPCFEDTFEGRIQEAEGMAFHRIGRILEGLSLATGKDYLLQRALTDILGGKGDE